MSFASYKYLFKLVLCGEPNVGKSALMTKYTQELYDSTIVPTIGVEYGDKIVKVRHGDTVDKVKLQIWDTAGQEKYRSISQAYYHGAMIAAVVYDITNRKSFSLVDRWVEDIKQHNRDKNCQIIIVGNKCDLSKDREVLYEEGVGYALEHGYEFCETSCWTGEGVGQVFNRMANLVYQKIKRGELDAPARGPGAIYLGGGEPDKKYGGCC